jgi:integrase
MAGRRRARNSGGLYQRASDGLWVGVLDLGWVDGKRRRKVVYGRTQTEALAKFDAARRAQQQGLNLTATPRTVEQWLGEWLTEHKARDGTRASTLARYQQVVRTHLVPGLGRRRLQDLSPQDVHRFLVSRSTVVSPATVAKIHGDLRAALSDAERMELVTRNAAKQVRPPSLGHMERQFLTPADARLLIERLRGRRYEAAYLLALGLGLRRGEVLGLRWSDVDQDAGTLTVRRGLMRVNGGLALVDTKTPRSRRTLPLTRVVVEALDLQRTQQDRFRDTAGARWRGSDLVITTSLGGPVEPRNLSRDFTALRDELGMPWLRFHDLRHAFATFLLAAGVEPRTVMEMLGHSTIRLTMDLYGHALPERVRVAGGVIDEALGGAR